MADANAVNDEWLALSSTISMLCEADLMALDEDLLDVPWGLVPTVESGEHHQILSPLAALGAPASLDPSACARHTPTLARQAPVHRAFPIPRVKPSVCRHLQNCLPLRPR